MLAIVSGIGQIMSRHCYSKARKWFERFREIPEWIDTEMRLQVIPHHIIIEQLEAMRGPLGKPSMGMNALSKHLKSSQKSRVLQASTTASVSSTVLFSRKHESLIVETA
jgi:hypothetical protein